MKAKIFAIFAIASMLATVAPVMATFTEPSTFSSQFTLDTNGVTTVRTLSRVYGWDGEYRAGVLENIYNDEVLNLKTSVDISVPSFGASRMVESKTVVAEGDTEIAKTIQWASPTIWQNTANFYLGGATISADDAVDVTNIGSGIAVYGLQTNSLINYEESFGFNMPTDCSPVAPPQLVYPTCLGC